MLSDPLMFLQLSRSTLYLLCPRLCFLIILNRDLCVQDELEAYHANRATNLMFGTTSETEGEAGPVKLS